MMRYRELPPDASRVINSLRDSGYDFNTAVADVVDNSIAASASLVNIFASCNSHDGEIRIAIADNGHGMTSDELCNALTYGSAERRDIHSLGKFGLGLKTASTSQCRRVSLVSRKEADGDAAKLVLDIDHAEKAKRWEYIEDEPSSLEMQFLNRVAKNGPGTVVVWEKCDRLMGRSYKNPGGRTEQAAFKKKINTLRFHLSIVFSRFLDFSDRRAPNVQMIVNGEAVKPFDPFARALDTEVSYQGPVAAGSNDRRLQDISASVAAYIVPSRDELGPLEREKVFPEVVTPDSLQGFFVYRENRLIHWGDWCGLYKSEFHYRLCRVDLSFSADLDDLFNVDFQKSKVTIDQEIANWLKERVLVQARAVAEKRYRKGVSSGAIKAAPSAYSKANKTISKVEEADSDRQFRVTPLQGGRRKVASKKGRSFVEEVPKSSALAEGSIRLVESLPDSELWHSGVFDDRGRIRAYVEINASHPFFRKARYAFRDNENAERCFDYLIWSLAQAEYATKDQTSLENYRDMILEVSRTLRLLAEDLPEAEE